MSTESRSVKAADTCDESEVNINMRLARWLLGGDPLRISDWMCSRFQTVEVYQW